MIIYCITNIINNKKYVGQTTKTLKERTRYFEYNKDLRKAVQRYGEDNFLVEQLDTASSQEELNQKEVYWIDKLSTIYPSGYNFESGGRRDYSVSEESRVKMKEAKLAYYRTHDNPFKGKKHSQETIKKNRVLHIGNTNALKSVRSDKQKINHGSLMRNLWKDPLFKEKQLQSRLGKKRGSYQKRSVLI